MEKRTCKCGCGRTFRVMEGSPSEFYSRYECEKKPAEFGRIEYGRPSDDDLRRRRKLAREKFKY